MTKFIGRLVELGIAPESVRGTYVAPTFWLPKVLFSVDDKMLKVNERSSYGNIGFEGNQALVAQRWAEGDIEFPFFDRSIGVFLKALFGTLSTTGPVSSVYTHTFSLQNDNQHDSISLSVIQSDIAELAFRLSMIESFEITMKPDQEVLCRVTFMSKRSADWTIGTPSYIAENKFVGRHLVFKLATDTSGLAAASHIPLRSLTLRFLKRLRVDSVVGTVDPADFLNQAFSIEGDLELNLENTTYKSLALDGSYRAARINLINEQVTIGGGSENPEFLLDLSRVHFEAWEPDYPNDEIVSQALTFKAMYDISNANIINNCYLKNTNASY